MATMETMSPPDSVTRALLDESAWLQRREVLRELEARLEVPDRDREGVRELRLAREHAALVAVDEELGEEKRQVLVLRLMKHRTNLEIAELLELEPNTVAVRYRRALDELRALLPESVFSEIWGFRCTPTETEP